MRMLCCNFNPAGVYCRHGRDSGLFGSLARTGSIDRWAIGLSGLCLVHCIAGAVLLTFLASAGGLLLHPIFHEAGMGLAILFGVIGLGRGIRLHGFMLPASIGSLGLGMMAGALTLGHDGGEMLWSIAGVLVLALGHDLNRRAVV
jgi:hypothetical protein